jgi:hypothetical protein
MTPEMIARAVSPGIGNAMPLLDSDQIFFLALNDQHWRYLILVVALVLMGAKRKRIA